MYKSILHEFICMDALTTQITNAVDHHLARFANVLYDPAVAKTSFDLDHGSKASHLQAQTDAKGTTNANIMFNESNS